MKTVKTLCKQIALALTTLYLCALSLQIHAASNTIGILVYDGVLSSDITAPIEVFGAASKTSWFSDYEVKLISPKPKSSITTEEGLEIKVDLSISEAPKLDLLVVPSTYDMKPLLADETLISFIRQQASKVKWLSSNCSGAYLLAEAGVLKNKQATTWAGGEADFQRDYPEVKVIYNKNYVIDGNILTSNGSVVSYQAALVLLEKLSSPGFANEIAQTIQWQRLASAFK